MWVAVTIFITVILLAIIIFWNWFFPNISDNDFSNQKFYEPNLPLRAKNVWNFEIPVYNDWQDEVYDYGIETGRIFDIYEIKNEKSYISKDYKNFIPLKFTALLQNQDKLYEFKFNNFRKIVFYKAKDNSKNFYLKDEDFAAIWESEVKFVKAAGASGDFVTVFSDTNKNEPYFVRKDSLQDNDNFPNEIGYKTSEETDVGPILCAWNWSYNNIKNKIKEIKDAGFGGVQVSPVQACELFDKNPTMLENWWKLYQPLNFSLDNHVAGQEHILGTKNEFKEMCEIAKKNDVKVVVDVVLNHMANNSDYFNSDKYTRVEKIYSRSPKIDPLLLNNENFWKPSLGEIDNYENISRYNFVNFSMGMPKLNISNKTLQKYIILFLKDLMDCGANGFRFDAAGHIELPQDTGFESDFWPNVLGELIKKNPNVFLYGEVFCNVKDYKRYMNTTMSGSCQSIKKAVEQKDISLIFEEENVATNIYGEKIYDPKKTVTWVESHDMFKEEKTNNNFEVNFSEKEDINLGWGLITCRKGTVPLFFARPDKFTADKSEKHVLSLMGDATNKKSSLWQNSIVKALNQFHKFFKKENEYIHVYDSIFVVERGDWENNMCKGVCITNLKNNKERLEINNLHLKIGDYKNLVTGEKVKINKSFSIEIPAKSVVVLIC